MRAEQHAPWHAARAEYILPSTVVSVGRARQLTHTFLNRPRRRRAAVGLECLDDAALVVSELMANAVEHGHGQCRLRLIVSHAHVTIAVHDSNPAEPRTSVASEDAECGRGMSIVHALAQHLDVLPTRHGPGKTVRAVLVG
ncbi:ATP-binding protein [Streptomyces sp. BH055]|uniref:ATP-binding protein n=1 Tax=unclassified Streptomyces TaxID=2593676 RepID=UPI003BB73866